MAARGRLPKADFGTATRELSAPDPAAAKKSRARTFVGPMGAEERLARRRAGAQRKSWEASPQGQARLHTASAEHKMPTGMVYALQGFSTKSEGGHRFDQPNLPGMERTDAAAPSTRWEDLPHHERARTERALGKYGTSLEQMHHDFGAHVDQAFMRAHAHGAEPFSQHFYTHGEPAQVLKQGAEAMRVPLGVHVAMNAMTSPNTKFKAGKGEKRYYPNDETARSVERQVQAGVHPHEVGLGASPRDPSKSNQGYVSNARKAADALAQHYEGKPVSEWKGRVTTLMKDSPEGKKGTTVSVPEAKQTSPFGEKTGPYHNAWLPGAQDYLVSDVHTGGGGFFPHLSPEKPVKLHPETSQPMMDKNGKPIREKSQRELAIEKVPNFHAAADYTARQVAHQRGLGSIRQMQAAQWGEEQIGRGIETEKHQYEEPAAEKKHLVSKQFADHPTLF